jgi:hypothetical protein
MRWNPNIKLTLLKSMCLLLYYALICISTYTRGSLIWDLESNWVFKVLGFFQFARFAGLIYRRHFQCVSFAGLLYKRNLMDHFNFEVPDFVDCKEWKNIVKLQFGRRSWVENGSELGRCGVLWGGSRGQEVCLLIGYKNFEVPEAVDNDISRKITEVIRS